MEENNNQEYRQAMLHDGVAGSALSLIVFLIPLFFIPLVSMVIGKTALVATSAILLALIFLWYFLADGRAILPKSKIWILLALLPLAILAASIFSGTFGPSFAGAFFELASGGSLVILALLIFLTALLVNSGETVRKVQKAFILANVILVANLIFLILASYGVVPAKILEYVPVVFAGGITDMAIILSCAAIFAMHTLSSQNVARRQMYLYVAVILAALTTLVLSGAGGIIFILGFFTLALFVYSVAWRAAMEGSERRAIFTKPSSLLSLGVLVVCIIFLIGGSSLSGFISQRLRVQNFEVRPNTEATLSIIKVSLIQNPLFGVGPNRFAKVWVENKPVEINQTAFWNTDFNYGSSFVSTLAATTGILGLGLFLAFLVLYIYIGFRFAKTLPSLFFASLFLWSSAFVYTPGIAVLALAAILSGLFLASLGISGALSRIEFDAAKNPKSNFVSIFGAVVLIIGFVAGGYYIWERIIGAVFFERASTLLALEGNTTKSQSNLQRALNISPTDTYLRRAAEISVANLQTMIRGLANRNIESLSEQEKLALQQNIAESVNFGRAAVDYDKKNYLNWFFLGRIYEVLATNGVEGALENAEANYEEAQKLAPNNPEIELGFARLESIKGNVAVARERIHKAISLKNDYTDAYFSLAQLEVANNNIPAAIQSVEAATLVDPNNVGLYFQLGLLKYNRNDFTGATGAFERAVTLVPNYANARYFLGLSYNALGRRAEAVGQFEEIEKTNPNNAEVELILTNLRAGRNPFADARPPIDDEPENREEPPIEEN